MNFDLTRPCDNCPFRSDIVPYIEADRALEIACDLERKTFACHKTVFAKQPRDERGRFAKRGRSHCAGALIIMVKINWQGDMQQIAERLGWYDPTKLDLAAPVYDSFEEWVKAHGLTEFVRARGHRGYLLPHLRSVLNDAPRTPRPTRLNRTVRMSLPLSNRDFGQSFARGRKNFPK